MTEKHGTGSWKPSWSGRHSCRALPPRCRNRRASRRVPRPPRIVWTNRRLPLAPGHPFRLARASVPHHGVGVQPACAGASELPAIRWGQEPTGWPRTAARHEAGSADHDSQRLRTQPASSGEGGMIRVWSSQDGVGSPVDNRTSRIAMLKAARPPGRCRPQGPPARGRALAADVRGNCGASRGAAGRRYGPWEDAPGPHVPGLGHRVPTGMPAS